MQLKKSLVGIQAEESDPDSMGDAIRENSDNDQDPIEESLLKYQEETQLKIKDIHLGEELPQHTNNKNCCKHTQDAQKFPVTQTKGMTYIHGTAIKLTVCVYNSQHPLIIVSVAHCSIVAKYDLEKRFPNQESRLLLNKEKKSRVNWEG
ncbi:hypothetical protein O181_047240 [Austropuccinia psidii MF-1]|uniref:Uncharacterized protein n=1 Tax=Austropuccinia psidii MF-1 TaxID=1389203 RepID=A0A9Q3DPV4_9BASI|nr:hypothetical protein [Austropuccinia psidii MF-1]